MVDRLALLLQLGERAGSDGLGLVRQRLAGLEPLRAAVQPVRSYDERTSESEPRRPRKGEKKNKNSKQPTCQQLLPLLKVCVLRRRTRVVAVARAEQGAPVVGQGAELAAVAVHVGLVVTQAAVDGAALRRRHVLLLHLHLVEQLARLLERPLGRAQRRLARLARQLRDLVQLLHQVRPDQLVLRLIVLEELGAGVRVERVGHGGRTGGGGSGGSGGSCVRNVHDFALRLL